MALLAYFWIHLHSTSIHSQRVKGRTKLFANQRTLLMVRICIHHTVTPRKRLACYSVLIHIFSLLK